MSRDYLMRRWYRDHPGEIRCSLVLMPSRATCAKVAALSFTARCAAGHLMQGPACASCARSPSLGCFACWQDGAGQVSPVITFTGLEIAS